MLKNSKKQEFYKALGVKIKELRELVFIDQVRIYKMTGIKPQTISDLESGYQPTASIPVEKVALLARLLGVSLSDLVPEVEIEPEYADQIVAIVSELNKRGNIGLQGLTNALQQALELPSDEVKALIFNLLTEKRLILSGDNISVGDNL